MNETRQFLMAHGASILFGAVLVEQLGLPLPALPWMLGAGALAAAGSFSLAKGIALAVLACLIADALWFYLGRIRGHQVLSLLCRISLEPDSCVRRTENLFSKYGWKGIVVAKFVPGLSTVVPPLAGMSDMSEARFLSVDAVGSLLYTGTFLCLGFFFSNQIKQVGGAIASIGSSALCLVGGCFVAYVAYKYWQRKRLLDELRMARISVADLRRMLDSGDNVVILDMRSNEEFAKNAGISGAIHLSIEDVKQGRYQPPRDREVVVYCSCPNDVTAARVALLLRRNGFQNVRPLLGGIDAWNEFGDAGERKAS